MSDQNTGKEGLDVWVDPKRCIGMGACATLAPGKFILDEETHIAELVDFEGATLEQLFAAARGCPTQAIIIEQYGHRVFPQIMTPMYESPNADSED